MNMKIITEEQIINSMVPIWKKNKSELTEKIMRNFISKNIMVLTSH